MRTEERRFLLHVPLPYVSSHSQQRQCYLKEGPLLNFFFFLSYMHELYSQSILRWTCKHSTTIKEGEAYNVMYLAITD